MELKGVETSYRQSHFEICGEQKSAGNSFMWLLDKLLKQSEEPA